MILYQSENSHIPYGYDRSVYTDFYFVAHLHGNFELISVLSGEVCMTVEHKETLLSTGEFALILPNQIHSFETPSASTVLVSVFAEEYVPFLTKAVREKRCLANNFRMSPTDTDYLNTKLLQDDLSREQLSAYLSLAAAEFLRCIPLTEEKLTEKSSLLLHRILEYVSTHYRENISLAEMAKSLGYESHYLSRCFHAYFNKNFKQFVNEYRINYAKHLISGDGKNMTMTEIAFSSGFQSVRSFNRAYHTIEGVEPREGR